MNIAQLTVGAAPTGFRILGAGSFKSRCAGVVNIYI